jgi:hypothetical protein
VGRKMLDCFLKAEVWPASRIVACTRSLNKVQAAAAAGVVCTNNVSAAMQGCRVLVLCCRADQLVNQASIHLRARDDARESERERVRNAWGSVRVYVIDARETKQGGDNECHWTTIECPIYLCLHMPRCACTGR